MRKDLSIAKDIISALTYFLSLLLHEVESAEKHYFSCFAIRCQCPIASQGAIGQGGYKSYPILACRPKCTKKKILIFALLRQSFGITLTRKWLKATFETVAYRVADISQK